MSEPDRNDTPLVTHDDRDASADCADDAVAPSAASVANYLLYGLSLPKRTLQSTRPYISAMWKNFSSAKETLTEDLPSGRLIGRDWSGARAWFAAGNAAEPQQDVPDSARENDDAPAPDANGDE